MQPLHILLCRVTVSAVNRPQFCVQIVRFASLRSLQLMALIIFAAISPAFAQSFDWLESAEINIRPSFRENRPIISDPQGNLLNTPTSLGQVYALFKLQKSFDDLRIVSQLRPRYEYQDDEQKTLLGVDELYLDYPLSQDVFISAGKRNIFTGVALGRNPVDYFGVDKATDTTLSAEERRDQRAGDYLLNLDWYLQESSFSAYYAPRIHGVQDTSSRFLLSYSQLFAELNTDVGLFLYDAQHDGVGLTLSKTFTDNWVAYAEMSVDKGRDRSITGITQNDDQDRYLEAVIGSSFTFDNGLNHIIEYWHHGAGYTDQEWDDINATIDFASSQLNTVNALNGFQQLGAINQGLTPNLLRKNYLFNRLSYPIPGYQMELSLVHIANTDDHSHLARLSVKKLIHKNAAISLQLQQTYGNSDTEFGLRTLDTITTLNIKWMF